MGHPVNMSLLRKPDHEQDQSSFAYSKLNHDLNCNNPKNFTIDASYLLFKAISMYVFNDYDQ